ncbi:MAG TPA: DUF4136 domain-containing protein [Allosphingosinicella sp.]|nr:DUF4136 domain-containing protein [Allosphingosinicella sp.]
MSKFASCCAALLAVAAVSGCAPTVQRYATATRFHLGQPIARGEIAVEPADRADANSLEFAAIAAPVERELTRLGWNIVHGNARSEQVAVVRVEQAAHLAEGSGFSIGFGVGGADYGHHGYGSGVAGGVGAEIPISGHADQVVATQLGVRIQRRSDATVAWEGHAEMEALGGTPLAGRAGAADRLAAALFQDFPGESGRTIRVR